MPASGKAGRAVVRDFLEHDHDVLAVDIVAPTESPAPSLIADLTDFGQTVECLAGVDAVVHLAAIPASGIHTEETTFRTNMLSTYNVFEAARLLGLRRVVWASSETILGLPFEREQPAYAPIDEEAPAYPESSYAISKVLSEAVGDVHLDRQVTGFDEDDDHVTVRFADGATEDADALVKALRKKHYPVFVPSDAPDKLFHVQVGPFTDPKEAEAMKARLEADGYKPIVKK